MADSSWADDFLLFREKKGETPGSGGRRCRTCFSWTLSARMFPNMPPKKDTETALGRPLCGASSQVHAPKSRNTFQVPGWRSCQLFIEIRIRIPFYKMQPQGSVGRGIGNERAISPCGRHVLYFCIILTDIYFVNTKCTCFCLFFFFQFEILFRISVLFMMCSHNDRRPAHAAPACVVPSPVYLYLSHRQLPRPIKGRGLLKAPFPDMVLKFAAGPTGPNVATRRLRFQSVR